MEIWFREVKQHKNITLDDPLLQEQAIKFANLLSKYFFFKLIIYF